MTNNSLLKGLNFVWQLSEHSPTLLPHNPCALHLMSSDYITHCLAQFLLPAQYQLFPLYFSNTLAPGALPSFLELLVLILGILNMHTII
jgi:hypothetical protein